VESDAEAQRLGTSPAAGEGFRRGISIDAPQLRVVSEDLWIAVHERLDASRRQYLRGTKGQLWGRPARGVESK
jgi:hypothetical protein